MIESVQDQMIKISGGEIELRDDRKKKTWRVDVRPFYLSKFLVTQELYSFISGQNPSLFKSPDNPVEMVSWLESVKFCNQLSALAGFREYYIVNENGEVVINNTADGYRLPTDAEWEYACKGNTGKPRYGEIDEIAWYESNSNGTTHKVGLKAPNEWGLYDMLGNVWEWCEDLYDVEVYGSYRVFRGGGWSDQERGILATNRRRSHPTYKIEDLGFRIARSIF